MGLSQFLQRWFWVVGLFSILLIGFGMVMNVRAKIRKNPGFGPGYREIILRFLLSGIIPFLVMGFGIETGKVPFLYDFLKLREMNTFVLLYWFSLLVVWADQTAWIFLREGAETLARHPGILRFFGWRFFNDISDPSTYKFLWILMTQALLFVIVVLALIPAN